MAVEYVCDECGAHFIGKKRFVLVRHTGDECHFDAVGCLRDWCADNGYQDDDDFEDDERTHIGP